MQTVNFRFSGYSDETLADLTEKISKFLSNHEFSSFSIGCHFNTKDADEIALLRKEFQYPLVKSLETTLKKPTAPQNPDINILVDFSRDLVSFQIKPVYLYARYNKLKRNISQTKHFCYRCKGKGCDFCNYTGILTKESVQDLVSKQAMKTFLTSDNKFHGAGREDVDVLMLGRGRPFVLELLNPKKRSANLKKLQEEINSANKGKIKISELQFTEKNQIEKLKSAKNRKIYSAKVECTQPINQQKLNSLLNKQVSIAQQTPTRVAKRRADLTRNHSTAINKIKKISEKEFSVEILASPGLYIKEFISGDVGRTKPSISTLLNTACKCTQLDVLEILD